MEFIISGNIFATLFPSSGSQVAHFCRRVPSSGLVDFNQALKRQQGGSFQLPSAEPNKSQLGKREQHLQNVPLGGDVLGIKTIQKNIECPGKRLLRLETNGFSCLVVHHPPSNCSFAHLFRHLVGKMAIQAMTISTAQVVKHLQETLNV